jgi:O-antigen/teichoic acid export membrane protein
MSAGRQARNDESEKERVDRELIELLNELRVAIPGIQILFAFLLTVPFAFRFDVITTFQRDVYFVALLSSALASALLIAPSAQHRILFRQQDKAQLLRRANVLAIAGLVFLAFAITAVILLITDILFSTAAVIVVSVAVAAVFASLWFAHPALRRRAKHESDAST